MKHLCITEMGTFLGTNGARLVVHEKDSVVAEYPLSRIRSITVAKTGISLSSNLILACASRGIKMFFNDYRGRPLACLAGLHSHAVAEARRYQMKYCESDNASDLASAVIRGKLRNQRAVLNYFAKYNGKDCEATAIALKNAATALEDCAKETVQITATPGWRNSLMGLEGRGAAAYFQALSQTGLLPEPFVQRLGRGADDVINSALNYGYAILSSYIWNAVINAGLEPFIGFLHVERPGKPSLVLDLQEEYRAWAVDRVIIKNRAALIKAQILDPTLKKKIITGVQKTFATKYPYKGRKMTLESILQRQVYNISGHFAGNRIYRPYPFKW